jgi:hypothetical protein
MAWQPRIHCHSGICRAGVLRGGYRLRAQPWEAHKRRRLPDVLKLILQPFELTEPQDTGSPCSSAPSVGTLSMKSWLLRSSPSVDLATRHSRGSTSLATSTAASSAASSEQSSEFLRQGKALHVDNAAHRLPTPLTQKSPDSFESRLSLGV